jgi:hypothetical protein
MDAQQPTTDTLEKGIDALNIARSPSPEQDDTASTSSSPVVRRDMASAGSPAPGARTFGANRIPSGSQPGPQPLKGRRPLAPAPRIGVPPSAPAGPSNGAPGPGGRIGQPMGGPGRGMPPPLMGMRGRGGMMSPGQGTGQTKLPPSLQAKMDAVGLPFLFPRFSHADFRCAANGSSRQGRLFRRSDG